MSTPKPGSHTDQNSLHNTNPASATPDQGRSAFSVSTAQGDEDEVQRSSQLGGEAYKQGSQTDKEGGKESETARQNTGQPLEGTKQGSARRNEANREQPEVSQQREDINNEPDQGPTPMDPDEQKEPGKPEHH